MIRKNIISNYIGASITMLAPILALPWYLAMLGPSQFGLVGFILMIQAFLGLIDAGMSQALVREMSVRLDRKNKWNEKIAELLFGFERVYWVIALTLGSITFALSKHIANNWLNLDISLTEIGSQAVSGAGIIFMFQFPSSLYRSFLVAAQKQVLLNAIILISSFVRHLGGVLIISQYPTITTYLIWNASVSLIETLIRSKVVWNIIDVEDSAKRWNLNDLLTIWRFVAGMSFATWLGALSVQMDRIILSRFVPIEQFGYYTIAATVSNGSLQLINPIIQATLPRAIQLRLNPIDLIKLSIKLTFVIGLLSIFGLFLYLFLGKFILGLWLNNFEIVKVCYPILSVLLLGSILNAFYNVGYISWIARGDVKKIFMVNLLALLLSIALIPMLVRSFGLIGAAFGWLSINFIG